MKSNIIIAVIAAILAVVSSLVLLNLRDAYSTRTNTTILADIAANTLARTERSIDQSLLRLGKLAEQGKIVCGSSTTATIDEFVFRSAKVKDAVFISNGQLCSGSRQQEVLTDAIAMSGDALTARNEKITFQAAKIADLSGLVMRWEISDTEEVVVFFNTTELVFDVLPYAIRDVANLEIAMSDGTMLGYLRDDMATAGDDLALKFASDRYPLQVELRITKSAMAAWGVPLPLTTKLAGGFALFGIFFLMTRGLLRQTDSSQSIKRALRNGSIIPYYQPVYSVHSGELLGFEVLARRLAKDGSLMSPATFIPLIERYGLGDDLLEVLLRHSARHMDSVLGLAHTVTLAFNVTPQQLSREGFVQWFLDILASTDISPDRIILEVTERQAINDLGNLQRNISALRDYDITIAIDDVGTGHNGLSSIHQLRADYLKIDKLFVDGVVLDKHAAALVKMLIEVGAQYGMQIIAEGVENEQQLEALRKLGVDEVQGFYMAKPMPASDAVVEFAHHRAVRTKLILAEGLKKPAKGEQPIAKSA